MRQAWVINLFHDQAIPDAIAIPLEDRRCPYVAIPQIGKSQFFLSVISFQGADDCRVLTEKAIALIAKYQAECVCEDEISMKLREVEFADKTARN